MMKFILDIVSTPAILVALIAILGLVLQKKKLPDIIKGGIKTFVGFLVVSGGAGIVQNSLNPFGTMFEHAFHLSGVVPNNEAIVAIFAGSEYIEKEISSGTSGLVYALQLAGQFAAGVFVILAGVRLILGEIVPAFKGISERLVPNSKPALDCPIVYTYAPNAVLIGFISSFIGGLVSMAIMIASGTVVILPGVVPHFFCGATAGVIGNASGGVRGATIGAFLQGILISFLPVFLMPVLGGLGFQGSTFSDADFGLSGIILGMLNQFGSQAGIVIGLVLILAVMFGVSFIKKPSAKEE